MLLICLIILIISGWKLFLFIYFHREISWQQRWDITCISPSSIFVTTFFRSRFCHSSHSLLAHIQKVKTNKTNKQKKALDRFLEEKRVWEIALEPVLGISSSVQRKLKNIFSHCSAFSRWHFFHFMSLCGYIEITALGEFFSINFAVFCYATSAINHLACQPACFLVELLYTA